MYEGAVLDWLKLEIDRVYWLNKKNLKPKDGTKFDPNKDFLFWLNLSHI